MSCSSSTPFIDFLNRGVCDAGCHPCASKLFSFGGAYTPIHVLASYIY